MNTEQHGKTFRDLVEAFNRCAEICAYCFYAEPKKAGNLEWLECWKHSAIVSSICHCENFERKQESEAGK